MDSKSNISSIHPSILSHLHLSAFLGHRLMLSIHLYHLLSHPLQLIGQLSVGPQQVLVVHQQAAHLKPSQGDIHQSDSHKIHSEMEGVKPRNERSNLKLSPTPRWQIQLLEVVKKTVS